MGQEGLFFSFLKSVNCLICSIDRWFPFSGVKSNLDWIHRFSVCC
jgi:hypothetical protein